MDLSFIKEQLETFSTFAGAIGDFLQLPAKILGSIVDWFSVEEGNKESNFSLDWAETSSNLGSSNGDDNAEASLSSKADDAE
ncbi:PorH family porin [Corynebacterium stationis]|uniref:PorH family porin n=1 Tax=Corynebacterium stationis TaxID=1705 RepID=UPI00076F8A6E|nr:PorH family porin [Corynebacterium stationis]AMJ45432.1 aminotransferase [Corynebacterium stationis]AQX71886.1 aminotransferase [Corynebacterium stationis]ASJ19567.1 aminotransferase [Corynebacterium stationis]HJG63377.1 PorH family porin [Corynebacterium stationis]